MTLPVEMTIGLYVEKVGSRWQISNPDGTAFDRSYKTKGEATRTLNYYRDDQSKARK